MKKIALSLLLSTVIFFACESKAGSGAVVGGSIGVGVGGAVGGGSGSLIGGGVGVTTGAAIGAALDEQDRENMQRESPSTLKKIDHGKELSIDDIKNMSKAGLSDSVIISQIDATESQFDLDSDEIIDLKNSGVSKRVINYMIQTKNS